MEHLSRGNTTAADPTRRFKDETLGFLAGLVEVTGAVFYSVDCELNATAHALYRLDTGLLSEYVEHFHKLDPLHPRRFAATDRAIVTMQEAMPRPRLERSAYYADFMRRLGVRHEAELYLRDGAALVGGISLLRSGDLPPFRVSELALLAKVRPFVEYSFRLGRGSTAPGALAAHGLTRREMDVVGLVCAGETNEAIGRMLGIALPTVKTHLEHVYAKVGVRSRTQLLARLRF